MKIHLVRDCLDKQVIDQKERRVGRVDGIAIDASGSGRPRVVAVEIGSMTLASRMPGPISRPLKWIITRMTSSKDYKLSVPISKIEIGRNDVRIGVDADVTEVRALEHWLRNRIIVRIPGA